MARDIRVAILGDSRDFSRAVRNVQQDAGKLNRSFAGIARVAAVGFGAAAVGVAAIGGAAVKSLMRIEKIGAQTDAVLKSTAGAAGVTRKHIDDLAGSIEAMSGVEAEAVTEGQNLLLTFTKIQNRAGKGNDVFDQATKAMVDMSVAMGTDIKSSSILVGKALNDPIKGVTALTRAGVQFTEKQKATIKRMVEMNDIAGAQKIILGELNTQFGGSAKALGNTLSGRIERIKHQFGTLTESLVARLMPGFERLVAWAANNAPAAMVIAERAFERVSEVVSEVGAAVASFVREKLSQLMTWWDEHGPAITEAAKGFAEDFQTWILEPMTAVATYVVEELVPKVATFVTWIAENEGALKTFGILIGVTLVGHYTKLATQATISAAKQVAAWVSTKAAAIASAASTSASITAMIAHWALLAAKAVIHAAIVVASWVATTVAARGATTAHGVAVAAQVAGWGTLSKAAVLHAARVAGAWAAALVPVAGVIAAAETINELTGQKLNPNDLSIIERLDPRKAFKGLSLDIPFFNDGGVMPGPLGKHSLAMVAGGETVIPTHKPGVTGGGGPVININVTSSDPDIPVSIAREMRSVMWQLGSA